MTRTALITSRPPLLAFLENSPQHLPSHQKSDVQEWTAIIQTGWQLALVPVMAWSSLYAASWQFWERSPRVSRYPTAIPRERDNHRTLESLD